MYRCPNPGVRRLERPATHGPRAPLPCVVISVIGSAEFYAGSILAGLALQGFRFIDVVRTVQKVLAYIEIGWLYPGKEICAVWRGDAVVFFRRSMRVSASIHLECARKAEADRG